MGVNPKYLRFLFGIGMLSITGLQISYVNAQQEIAGQNLNEQLDALNKGFTERMDPAVVKNIQDAVDEVTNAGILENVKKTGDQAPDFTLPDATGEEVQLSKLLKQGPVVLTWYRGNW